MFPCSTQLSTKFILLINIKMPTIVGILMFISMINTMSERLQTENFILHYFTFYKQLKEHIAIRRTFSLVDMITNTKFSNCPNVFEIGVVWQ